MFRYRLAYLLLIGFGVFFYIAFVGYFSYYFLLLILILPVLSLFYLVMSFKFTKLDFAILNQKVIQDDFVKIKIIKDNLGLGAIKFVVEDQKYLIKGKKTPSERGGLRAKRKKIGFPLAKQGKTRYSIVTV